MSRLFYHVMQDNVGNLLFNVTGTMRLAGSGTLATIYGDEGLSVILPNPMTNHASFGSFKCFLGAGDYDFYMAKAGYTFETLTGVQGYGGMAQQESNAVVITGGTISGITSLAVVGPTGIGIAPNPAYYLTTGGLPSRLGGALGILTDPIAGEQLSVSGVLGVSGAALLKGSVGVSGDPIADAKVTIWYPKDTHYGLLLRALNSDTGHDTVQFVSIGGGSTGSITTTNTTTAYNTSSDGRLKEGAEPLRGAMDVIRALNPVSFRWKSDGSSGHGLIAQEVAQVVPGVVSGTETLGIDYSKLVPWLVSAVKELTEQVETLTAKMAQARA